MYALSPQQVALVAADVKRAHITLSHLADDLTDHICCEVEELMWEKKSFDEAYALVMRQAGIAVLKEIQENTHYLIDKNYRTMKMTMKITGNISLALMGIGTVAKLLYFPGASILLVLGFALLCLAVFPSAIYTSYRSSKLRPSKFLHGSALIGGMLFLSGVLFKLMHWPAAGVLLLVGWLVIIFVFLPTFALAKLRQPLTARVEKWTIIFGAAGLMLFELSQVFKLFHWPGAAVLMILGAVLVVSVFIPMYTRTLLNEAGRVTGTFIFAFTGVVFFVLLSSLLALNASSSLTGQVVNEANSNLMVASYLRDKTQKIYNEAELQSNAIPLPVTQRMDTIRQIANDLLKTIEQQKISLVMAAEGVDEGTAKQLANNPERLNANISSDLVTTVMLGKEPESRAYQLKGKLTAFNDILKRYELLPASVGLVNSPVLSSSSEPLEWELFMFDNTTYAGAMATLTSIEMRAKLAELNALRALVNQ